jgi:hypothetical protein
MLRGMAAKVAPTRDAFQIIEDFRQVSKNFMHG